MTTTAPQFGLDLACGSDLDPTGREIAATSTEGLAQCLVHRLDMQRGALVEDGEDGEDAGLELAAFLSRGMTDDEIASLPARISGELEKDERVNSVATQIVQVSREVLRLQFFVTPNAGPTFRMTTDTTTAGTILTGVS